MYCEGFRVKLPKPPKPKPDPLRHGRSLLAMIEAEPGISKSELARRTGMSRPWVIKHLGRVVATPN